MTSERNYCPLCKKRIFDLVAEETKYTCFSIELKCPNCRNIVRVNHSRGTEAAIHYN